MSRIRYSLGAVALFAIVTACGGDKRSELDEALRQDLSLAARAYPYQPYVSPLEQGYPVPPYGYQPQPYGYPPQAYPGGYQQAVARPAPVQRAPTIYRAPARTSAGSGEVEVVKNTKRDAIIGATAGAAIGAVTSRDKLKGAVIGAAAGGLLGAVIGNNVDVKRIPRR